MKVTVEDVMENMGFDWLWDGPVEDAAKLPTLDDAIKHIDGCIKSACCYDFFREGQELAIPHQLVDSVRDYPDMMAEIQEIRSLATGSQEAAS